MIRRDGARLVVAGPVTLASVAGYLEAGRAAIRDGAGVVDLAEVRELDSSALALVLAWQREAARLGRSLELANPPEGLSAIARLYGVAGLLSGADQPPHH
jgi:phospholipid transport system transporter-binding protein